MTFTSTSYARGSVPYGIANSLARRLWSICTIRNICSPIDLRLNLQVLRDWANKECREQRMLVKLLDKELNLTQMPNFIETDDFEERGGHALYSEINKIKSRNEPCYIAGTTGGHAFAMKIDFMQNTIFVANPAGKCENFNNIIERIQGKMNIQQVIWANITQLNRGSYDIDIQDTCTGDSFVLVDMMRSFKGNLFEGCLNDETLNTGLLAWQALAPAQANHDDAFVDGESKEEFTPKVPTIPNSNDPLNPTSANKTITKVQLQSILANYRPKSFVGILLWVLTFGTHRSETIKALDALCKQAQSLDDKTISLDAMINEISKVSVVDKCKEHRLKLFRDAEEPNQSGTDQVITNIKNLIG